MTVYFDGEEDALLGVVDACVTLVPMTVENAASAVFLMAVLANEGGKVDTLESIVRDFLGEERYAKAFAEMTEAVKRYVNNRTVELGAGMKELEA